MPKIVFNENFGVDEITIVLERRDFSKYGKLKDVTDIEYKDTMNAPELSFNVYKTDDQIWDKINNYNLVYIPEYKEHFSISVNTTEENTTQKSVTCTYLPVSELQNVKLRNIQINTEDDIARDDYDADYPTIFYRDLSAYSEGSTMYKKLYNASLLHRILDKASNYKIGHVDTSLKDLKSWFQYSISDSNIYDELTGEISDDYQCLFKFDSNTRTVNVYDLCNTCHDCGYRGDFHDKCPECGNTNYNGAYGEDTSIYVSKENLSTSASIESSEDSLKNCFYITGGDDLMTSAVAIANPSGTNYIVEFSDEMYENMPEDLVTKIKTYNSNYQDCMSKKKFTLSANLVEGYNTIVKYINAHYPKIDDNGDKVERYNVISSPIIGYKNIASLCFDCIDIGLILQTSMGKTIEMDNLTIQETMNLLTFANLSPIAVKSNVSWVATSVVSNTVLGACKALINTALYKVEIVDASYSKDKHVWKGKFKLTSIEDKTITLIGSEVSIAVNNDMEKYLKQNIQRCLNKLDTNYKDLKSLETSDSDFQSELAYYSFDYLSGLKDSFGDVLGIILESEQDELKNKYQTWYSNRIGWLENEMNKRQAQIDIVHQLYNYDSKSGSVYNIQNSLQDELNLESYLGKDMWITFCAFRMEDTYQNDNYISDGLDNGELVTRATELIDTAKKELYKASHVQYTVSSTINNLLALKEFQPIVNKFETGNWIHVCVDEKIYYLRLLSYKIFYSDISKIEVEFSTVERTWSGSSDVKSVIDSAQAIASSFSYTIQKVKNNTGASKYVQDWVQKGMNATVTKIVNNADNQNVVYDSSGILCRAYDDLTETYDLCQSRWINSGLYITDDGWQTVKAAIGKYIYVNPETGNEVTTMGVIGDTIVGKLLIGENLGIYNTNNSMTFNSDGLTITNGTNTFIVNPNDEKLFRITKSSNDVLWADKNGNLNLTGNITGSSITGGKIYGTTISGAEVSSSSFIGGNINIGDDNFIVDAGGNITSKGVLNLANGGVTYNSKDGLKVTGTINANGGTFSNTITCTGTISGGIIKASQFLANKFKATSDGNAYMISPYISSSIYMTGLGDFDDNSNYKEVIGSTFIHGVFYPILSGKWYANDLFASSFHIDAGDGYGVNITNSEISIVPFSVGSATSKINSKGIETTGNITCLGTINGNSSTATKLKTPRTLTIGRAGRVFDGSDNIGWTLADIGAATQNEVNSLKSRIEALEGRINS
nr:MAG TPA: hydrogenase/urease nickel incorporation protein [Bacteriophage sp.]